MEEENILNEKLYDLIIIGGLGHVGLPLGLVFAQKGLNVCLLDKDQNKANMVMRGIMPFIEYGSEPILKEVLNQGRLKISFDKNDISRSKNVIVTLGTGIDEYLNPETKKFMEAISDIKNYLDSSQTLIIRSTVFPNMCRQLHKSLPEINLAYCPERIAQGYGIKELSELPQVVSGFNEKAIRDTSDLFSLISPKVIVTTPEEAELVKLFTNSYRYIQFATSNQYYMLAKKLGVDFDRVREVMQDGYGRVNILPSAGFAAGPCLFKDTMHLVASDNANFPLGNSAMIVNEGLPNFIVDDLKKRHDLSKLKVGILGMAFKAEVDDIRDSLSYKLLKILKFYGAEVYCSDEFAIDPNFVSKEELIKNSNIIIIGAPHSIYKEIPFPSDIEVIDLWNIIKKDSLIEKKFNELDGI